ncbi:MAG: hypothetical protein POH28_14835, partial [Acidocella sp.]|nr:hypothetical protein [Acidocella sp.]
MRRFIVWFLLLALLISPSPGGIFARAQSLAVHQSTAASSTTPMKAPAAAIIPGSPLAALTGGALPSDADANTPTPFGSGAIGLSVASAMGNEAARTLGVFVAAVRESTELKDITIWVGSFSHDPLRRAHLMDIITALAITIIPGLALEALVGFALRRPRRYLAAHVPPMVAAPMPPGPEKGLEDAEAGETEEHPGRRASIMVWLRRFAFALLHFGLGFIPLVGFALAIQGLVSAGLITTRPAHLVVVGITNAYLICRFSMEILRLLAAPAAPRLRLVHMSQNRARWLVSRLRILLGTGFFGYALVSISEVLGLDHVGATVLVRLIALAIHIEVALCIWQCRRVVGGWIGGRRDATGVAARVRQRLGAIWHYPALFYVLALWVAWAGGVQNAFGVLLRVVLVFIAAMTMGRLLW